MRKTVHIVAESSGDRAEQARASYALGYHAEIYTSPEELLASRPTTGIVLIEDAPDIGNAWDFLARMLRRGVWLPVIATAHAIDPERVVTTIKSGALDYLPLPLDPPRLLAALQRTEREAKVLGAVQRKAVDARERLAQLTAREREVLESLTAGASNKAIARDLAISPRTVEIHRANMMAKLGAGHAADAVRLRLEAAMGPAPGQFAITDDRLAA